MTRSTDPQKIAEMLEAERDALGRTLQSLSRRFSATGERGRAFGADAAPYVTKAGRSMMQHPFAFALAGAGIAWLLFGRGHSAATPDPKAADVSEWENEGGHLSPTHPDDPDVGQTWRVRAELLQARANQTIARIEEDASAHAADLKDGLFARASALRDFAGEKSAVVADLAEGLTDTLRTGLSDLSDEAQTRIIAVREAVLSSRSVPRLDMSGARRLATDHPLLLGAVALALGAAVAISLPRAKGETGFAAERDRLIAEALRLMGDKRRVAQDMAAAAGEILTEAAKDSAASIADKAKATAEKLRDEVVTGLKAAKG